MSASEEACRWRIVQAYVAWLLSRSHTSRPGTLAYARAIGLERTDPRREERS